MTLFSSPDSLSLATSAVGNLSPGGQHGNALNVATWGDLTPHAQDASAPNNTYTRATDLGILGRRSQVVRDAVGAIDSTDPQNFYQFHLARPGNFQLTLSDLTANLDVILWQAREFGIPIQIAASNRFSTEAETIQIQGLGAGDYFVQVVESVLNQASGIPPRLPSPPFPYTLTLSAPSGSLLEQEDLVLQDLGRLVGSRRLTGSLERHEPNDLYQFELNGETTVQFTLKDRRGIAAIDIARDGSFNGSFNGQFETDEIIYTATPSGRSVGSFVLEDLPVGQYFIVIRPDGEEACYRSGRSRYTLEWNAIPSLQQEIESNTTLELANDIGTLVQQFQVVGVVGNPRGNPPATFRGFDEFDYYRFELNQPSTLHLGLTVLGTNFGTPELRLIQDYNGNGQVDDSEIIARTTSQLEVSDLAPGTYYVAAYRQGIPRFVAGGTAYHLTLEATH